MDKTAKRHRVPPDSTSQCDTFLSHGAENVLSQALTNHSSIAHDVKSALRDIGCKVHLDEEWKAHSGIQIQNEEDSEDISAFQDCSPNPFFLRMERHRNRQH
ncbi:hypothetical protein quinque_013023 [Culex quinquefasciatus]